jgi:hypothetical protein
MFGVHAIRSSPESRNSASSYVMAKEISSQQKTANKLEAELTTDKGGASGTRQSEG